MSELLYSQGWHFTLHSLTETEKFNLFQDPAPWTATNFSWNAVSFEINIILSFFPLLLLLLIWNEVLKLLELNLHLALNMPSLTQWLFFASEAIRSAPEIVQQFSQVIDSWRILWATAQYQLRWSTSFRSLSRLSTEMKDFSPQTNFRRLCTNTHNNTNLLMTFQLTLCFFLQAQS